jgi:hypothetical protein
MMTQEREQAEQRVVSAAKNWNSALNLGGSTRLAARIRLTAAVEALEKIEQETTERIKAAQAE